MWNHRCLLRRQKAALFWMTWLELMQGPQPSRDPRTEHLARLVCLLSVPYGLPSIFVMFKSRDEKNTSLVKFSFLHADKHVLPLCFVEVCCYIYKSLCTARWIGVGDMDYRDRDCSLLVFYIPSQSIRSVHNNEDRWKQSMGLSPLRL